MGVPAYEVCNHLPSPCHAALPVSFSSVTLNHSMTQLVLLSLCPWQRFEKYALCVNIGLTGSLGITHMVYVSYHENLSVWAVAMSTKEYVTSTFPLTHASARLVHAHVRVNSSRPIC